MMIQYSVFHFITVGRDWCAYVFFLFWLTPSGSQFLAGDWNTLTRKAVYGFCDDEKRKDKWPARLGRSRRISKIHHLCIMLRDKNRIIKGEVVSQMVVHTRSALKHK